MERAANTSLRNTRPRRSPLYRLTRLSHRSPAVGMVSPAQSGRRRGPPVDHFLRLTFSVPDARLVPVRLEESLV
jgi:hypothetical protein